MIKFLINFKDFILGKPVSCESLAIQWFKYNIIKKQLTICFKQKTQYKYKNVSNIMAFKLFFMKVRGKSVGKWFWENIRVFPDKYPYIKIT